MRGRRFHGRENRFSLLPMGRGNTLQFLPSPPCCQSESLSDVGTNTRGREKIFKEKRMDTREDSAIVFMSSQTV